MRIISIIVIIETALSIIGGAVFAGPLADATADSLWGIQLGGYLDVSYNYDFNDPNDTDESIYYHVFNDDDNQIQLDSFQLYIDKLPKDTGEVGFRFDILAGEDADWFEDLFGGYNNDINIYQAYVSYIAPIGNGLTIDIGRFASAAGYETIESPRNDQFSRSILFYYQPWTETGIRLTYAIDEQWEIMGSVIQGMDQVEDNNNSWTFHGAVRWTPTESVHIQDTIYYGPENKRFTWTDTNSDGVIDPNELAIGEESNDDYTLENVLSAAWDINESWTLGSDFTYQYNEKAIPTSAIAAKDAERGGLAGYVRYNVNPSLYLAMRGEYFYDCDNYMLRRVNREDSASMWEVTATMGYTVTEGFLTRLEYRHDDCDYDLFPKEDGFDSQQDTISVEMIYAF